VLKVSLQFNIKLISSDYANRIQTDLRKKRFCVFEFEDRFGKTTLSKSALMEMHF